MPIANPYARYQQTAVGTADRGDLLILSYEALVRWLNRASEAIDAAKIESAHDALINAQALVRSLMDSLDLDRGGEVAKNLYSLYDFVLRQLVEANVQKDKDLIASTRELVAPLLEAWRVAVSSARKQGLLATV